MTAPIFTTDFGGRAWTRVLLLACLGLAACGNSPPPPTHWVKAGASEATTERELDACRQQANAVLARQQGVNEDITATLGGNWQLSSTYGIETQSLKSSAQGLANQVIRNCMQAKGFKVG
jgi:hypothetical protein